MAKDKEKRLEDQLDEFSQEPIREEGEVAGAIKVLLEDNEDPVTKRSSIDQKTILMEDQVPSLSVTEIFGELGVIPDAKNFTNKIKRHAISINGRGRDQVVQVSTGVMQQQQGIGTWERLGNLFKPKQ